MHLRKILSLPLRLISEWRKGLNIYKTCYLNFKFLSFKQACKLPIYVYGKLQLGNCTGKIIISTSIKSGMIVFGANIAGFEASQGISLLDIGGTIRFEGSALFGRKCTISTQETAVIVFGHCCRISNSVKIRSYKYIEFKPFVSITPECQVFDTNFHYMRNIETGEVLPLSRPVIIGKYCWIGNRTSIMKGTILPDYTIVSSNSLVTRDFSSIKSYSIIGGMPAKLLKENVARVYEWDLYDNLEKHFTKSNKTFHAYTGTKDESFFIEKAYF